MRIELRDAGVADAPAVADIHLRARAAAGDAFPAPVHADEEYLPHLLADVLPVAEVRLAVRDGVVIGFAVLEDDLLSDLYVAPEAQGTGAGSALLADAKARRSAGLRLWVFLANRRARAFYERHGFVIEGGTSGANEEGAPDVRMRWPGGA